MTSHYHTTFLILTFLLFAGQMDCHRRCVYSGSSLLRSPTVLAKSDPNGEVTLLQGVICTLEYNLGQSHGDCNEDFFDFSY